VAGMVGAAYASDSWLHIKVDEEGAHGESVRINLPFKMIEALLPLLDDDICETGGVSFSDGRIRFECDIDLKAVLEVVEDAQDAEYITVQRGRYETVRVAKEDGWLLVNVEEDDEDVKIRMKLEVVKACLTDQDEIDLVAAARALRKHGEGDLVLVEGEDETVRIWVDSESSSD
jgi:hypothetical protein